MINKLELYLHIPFCVRKCDYCDFLSAPAEEDRQEAYVHALIREVHHYRYMKEEYLVTSVFVGGGTPSILKPAWMRDIFAALKETFLIAEDAELTIEVNPGTVTEAKLKAYRDVGINRLSIGLQSVNDEELQQLGRIHTFAAFLETFRLARTLGFDNINLDLMGAIPGQTVSSWAKTLHTTAALEPEHISAYSLMIEEGTPFYERYGEQAAAAESTGRIPLPGEEEERQMYADTLKILHGYGYHRYEISNYAKAGYECRHNIGYWTRKDYLGLGIGAASLLCHRRFTNTRDLAEYLRIYGTEHSYSPEFPHAMSREEEELLTPKEEREETIFLGLRMTEGIVWTDEMQECYAPVVRRFTKEGCLEMQDGRLRLTEKGISVSNYVLSKFL